MAQAIVQRIAGSIRVRIPALISEKLKHKPIEEMSVEELLNYAMGCNFVPTNESWGRSRRALELVLKRDSKNWMAATMLCWNLIGMSRILGWRNMEKAQIDQAQAEIDKAARVRSNDHLVRTVRGTLSLFGRGDLQAARLDLEEALKLNPNYYHTIDAMALIDLAEGNSENAVRLSQIALSCDPAYPYRHLYHRDAGQVALVVGDYDGAIQHLMHANFTAPDLPANLALLCAAQTLAGNKAGAQMHSSRLEQIAEDFDPALFARLPYRDGSTADLVTNALINC